MYFTRCIIERGKTMSETTKQQNSQQRGGSKRLISIILVAILVAGASVTAYAFLNKSPKEKYFLAEKKSSEFIMDKVDQRFGHELEWRKKIEENPRETTYDFSAQMNSGSGFSTGLFSPEQIVNNSNLTLTTATDLDNKIVSTGLSGSIAGIEIEGFDYYLTSEEVLVDLPFEDEILQVKGKDVGHVFHALDPYSTDENVELDFNTYFEWAEGFFSDEDKEYFKKEYLQMIYDDLPENAFQTDKDKVTINGNSINAEKITMHLTEEEVKDLLSSIIEKMANDKRVKEKLDEIYNLVNLSESMDPSMAYDVEDFIEEFEEGLDEIVDEINDLSIPEGITSTIWVKKNLIVQRDFMIEMGSSDTDLVTITYNGTQLLEEAEQLFDYELSVEDDYSQETLFFLGNFSTDKDKATDSIELSMDDTTISYEATETLEDNKKEFDRVISVDDVVMESKILWSGSANYDKEQMNSNHELSVEDATIDSDMLTIHIEKDAKLVKEVEQPNNKDSKDLGNMDDSELVEYFQYDLPTKFEDWLYGNMDTPW